MMTSRRPLLTLLFAAAATAIMLLPAGAAEPAKWVFHLYISADCDLEAQLIGNLEELAETGAPKGVEFIALVDRSRRGATAEDADEGYSIAPLGEIPNWSGGKLLRMEGNVFKELADWGDCNMGAPETLSKFMVETAKRFPAERRAVVLSNHGGAWTGICWDEGSDSDALSLADLAKAFAAAAPSVGKWDLIGFDACLMANLETLHAVSPYAKVVAASEQLVPGDGWNYVTIARELARDPGIDGLTLAARIGDGFRDYFSKADRATGISLTMASIDCAAVPALVSAVDNFAAAAGRRLAQSADAWDAIAAARAKSDKFGGPAIGNVDLGNFAANLAAAGDPALAPAAQAISKALAAAVRHVVNGRAHADATGISIFFPSSRERLEGDEDNRYADTAFGERPWFAFLEAYTAAAEDRPDVPVLSATTITSPKIVKGGTSIFLNKADSNLVETAAFAVAGAAGKTVAWAVLVEPDESKGWLSYEWDGTVTTISCGGAAIPVPLIIFLEDDGEEDEGEDENAEAQGNGETQDDAAGESASVVAMAPASLRRGGKTSEVRLVFDFQPGAEKGELLGVLDDSPRGGSVELLRGDTLEFQRLSLDGESEPAPLKLVVKNPDALSLSSTPVAAGAGLAGFIVVMPDDSTQSAMAKYEYVPGK